MRRLLQVQTLGSLAGFALIIASGVSALCLALAPSAPLFWYLDRELFGAVRLAGAIAFPATGPQLLVLGVAGAGVALLAHVKRWRFVAALMSHACFLLLAQPAHAWLLSAPPARTASLTPFFEALSRPNAALALLSLGAAALSVLACHAAYLAMAALGKSRWEA